VAFVRELALKEKFDAGKIIALDIPMGPTSRAAR